VSTSDPIASILTALDRPVQPRPEFAESLRADLLAELRAPVDAPRRRRLRLDWFLPQAPPRVRLVLIAALLLLLLAGIATATYIGVRAAADDNGPLTLIGDAGISTIGPDGRLHTVVRCPPTAECGVLQSVDWSPDGTRLAYSINTFAANSPHAGLHVLDTASGKDTHILGGKLGCVAPFDLDWSSDGTRLVYACATSGPGWPAPGIYVIEPDGSDRRLLQTGLSGRHASPTWAPDGRRIAFAFGKGGQSAIYVFDLGASRLTHVVARGSAPAWSPDRDVIAYRSDCGVKLATPDGRDVTPIRGPFRCQAVGIPGVPVWSPDGKKIAIGTRSRGIYVMNADGSDMKRLTEEGASGATGLGRPSWRPVGAEELHSQRFSTTTRRGREPS
jgi:dipeptidyl aminopeptidase/acylaminoacyl peptidase